MAVVWDFVRVVTRRTRCALLGVLRNAWGRWVYAGVLGLDGRRLLLLLLLVLLVLLMHDARGTRLLVVYGRRALRVVGMMLHGKQWLAQVLRSR